jgi:hypothetical protein
MEREVKYTSIEEIGTAIVVLLRVVAFVFGAVILVAGLVNVGAIGGNDFLSALTLGPLGMLEIPVGLVLMLAGIEPRIIAVAISWVIR